MADYGTTPSISQDLVVPDFDITVLEVKHVNSDSIRAFVKVKVGPFIISNCRVIHQTGQDAWFSLPAEKGKDGRWWRTVELTDRALLARVREAVLDAWRGSVG